MAELLADQEKVGARVAIIDTNLVGITDDDEILHFNCYGFPRFPMQEAAEKVAQGIVKRGGYAAAWKCDVVDGDEMRKTADKIKRHFGG
jgi:NAD(P)-dependent dehydrogenase (short-subunit alcohol dehydrogenase family)